MSASTRVKCQNWPQSSRKTKVDAGKTATYPETKRDRAVNACLDSAASLRR